MVNAGITRVHRTPVMDALPPRGRRWGALPCPVLLWGTRVVGGVQGGEARGRIRCCWTCSCPGWLGCTCAVGCGNARTRRSPCSPPGTPRRMRSPAGGRRRWLRHQAVHLRWAPRPVATQDRTRPRSPPAPAHRTRSRPRPRAGGPGDTTAASSSPRGRCCGHRPRAPAGGHARSHGTGGARAALPGRSPCGHLEDPGWPPPTGIIVIRITGGGAAGRCHGHTWARAHQGSHAGR